MSFLEGRDVLAAPGENTAYCVPCSVRQLDYEIEPGEGGRLDVEVVALGAEEWVGLVS